MVQKLLVTFALHMAHRGLVELAVVLLVLAMLHWHIVRLVLRLYLLTFFGQFLRFER